MADGDEWLVMVGFDQCLVWLQLVCLGWGDAACCVKNMMRWSSGFWCLGWVLCMGHNICGMNDMLVNVLSGAMSGLV